LLLGIDLGTSSVRVAVVDECGNIRGLGQKEYPIEVPRPGWAEQDVGVWWRNTVAATRQALAEADVTSRQITGLGLSGQMHGTVLVNERGEDLGPAVIWADTRSSEEAARLNEALGLETLAQVAGSRVAPGFMAATLAWIARYEPQRLEVARYALLPKDYLRLRLTGEVATEPSDGSATLLMDINEARWSGLLTKAVGVEMDILPPVIASTDVAGQLSAAAAAELGLPEGLPVVAGAGDQAAQAVGNGVITGDVASSTIGTGGQLLQPCRMPKPDPQLRVHCFCHALPGVWFLMGAILSAGLSLRWWRDILGLTGSDVYARIDEEARGTEPGAGGVIFLPYLLGERTPHMDPRLRGAFIGLTLRHGRGHLARAIMEGVVFALRQGMDIMAELAEKPAKVVASGGGAKSDVWMHIQADGFGLPITTVVGEERAVVGAAMLAGVGTGVFGSPEEAREACVRYGPPVMPEASRSSVYESLFELYRDLLPPLQPYLHALCSVEQFATRPR